MTELRQNGALGAYLFLTLAQNESRNVSCFTGRAFEQIFNAKYGEVDRLYGISSASTDFVGVP